jgi:RNA polymerase sigma factor (sigma-70 family)
MPPPPAEQLASRIFLGPALRAQPDRRLVTLVREGYESAFEEIVRRYRRPLDRFAASIVGGNSEDVTQDAFSKALLALRGSEAEIELRPWLYRIVRNTALNDLRDRPPATEELGEAIVGGHSASVEAERREEMSELMERLGALPEPQRAAIVMRELEGLSHEEIAASLGLSGGAARQVIYRARQALREGLGLLLPLPLLRMLFDHGAEAAGAGAGGAAVAAAGTAAGASGGIGATLGGLGAGGALKIGVAAALIAGSVGAGVAVEHNRSGDGNPAPAAASAAAVPSGGEASEGDGGSSGGTPLSDNHSGGDGSSSGSGQGGGGDGGHRGPGSGGSGDRGRGQSGSGGDGHSGDGTSGGSQPSLSGSGSGGDGGSGGSGSSVGSGDGSHTSGSGSGGSGISGGGGGDGGSSGSDDGSTAAPPPVPPAEMPTGDGGSGSGSSGSGSGSGDSGSGSGDDGL